MKYSYLISENTVKSFRVHPLGVSSRIRTLMMGTEMIPETSVSSCNQLTQLCAREDFIEFRRHESFKLYIRKHVLLMSSVFGSDYRCEQLFSWMQNVKSRSRTRLTDEHLEGCTRMATTGIITDAERLLKQNQCHTLHLDLRCKRCQRKLLSDVCTCLNL
jgi:hypothetical protein